MPYPHGLFSWTDVSLPEPAAGSEFYTALFGWEAEDQHTPDGDYVYTMFSRDGRVVAGMGPRSLDEGDAGAPPMWTAYVAVDDLDETLRRWTDAGGGVIMGATDVMAAGRMAVVSDPQGAVLALWEAGEHRGAEAFGEPGTMVWNELNTPDPGSAREFYGAALGWEFEATDAGPTGEYWMIRVQGKADDEPYRADAYNGGVLAMGEDWPEEVPPHWMVYFGVEDTDAAVERLTGLGGRVSVPPFDTPAGRIAVVSDPQGGTFSVIAPGSSG